MDHTFDRPSWKCTACGEAWPCEPARDQLRTEHSTSPTALVLYMLMTDMQFAEDNPNAPVKATFDRFLDWTYP